MLEFRALVPGTSALISTLFLSMTFGCTDQPAAGTTHADADAPARGETAPSDWQGVADGALAQAGLPGAVVVLDVATGELVAAAERPGLSEAPASESRSPGSVVKPFLTLGALHDERVRADEAIDCAGPRELDGHTLSCFHDHGPLTLRAGLATSCNHYAFEIADRLGREAILEHFEAFGFGRAADGDTSALIGTGHGAMAVSPQQLARAYATLATGADSEYSEAEYAVIHAALGDVVTSEQGTGHAAAVPGLAVAGKTGTTDTGEGEAATRLAWFAGWAPADDPQVVVVVQIEGGGTGPESAAPVAGEVFAALTKG